MTVALDATRTSRVTLLVVMAALCTTPGEAGAQQAQPSLEMMRRGRALVDRLRSGLPTRMVAFGDSITDGWGTDGTHVYHRMFAQCLRYRFPGCELEQIVSGHPGETTWDALGHVQNEVIYRQPHLLLVQFGGNDRGWGRPLGDFRRDYARLLSRVSEDTDALVIACLPPMAEEIDDNIWSATARQVTAREGLPAADFHLAIRDGPHDSRSSFPYSSHPGSFTHVIMAKAVLKAFDLATGATPTLTCSLVRGCTASAEDTYRVMAEIASLAEEEMEWTARLEFGQESWEETGTVEPGAPSVIEHSFAVPTSLPAGRSFAIPVRLWVLGGGYGAFDVGWLVMAPAVRASRADAQAWAAELPRWHEIGPDALSLGRHLWTGPADLSGRFSVEAFADRVRLDVRVMDDDIAVAEPTDPAKGDSVELYVDLRSQERQGEPIYSPDVLALQVIPPSEPWEKALWHNMHELPEDLADITVEASQTGHGYQVRVELPMAAIQARRGENWEGCGFDVGINDADGGTRKTQMMAMGIGDNYLNPGYLAGLYLREVPEGTTRRTLR